MTARRLQPWDEARGQLHGLQDLEGCLVARIGPVTVALPDELREKLRDKVGHKIGILRTDADYRFRCLDEEKNAA
ncbi:MAG: hypothetical protein WAW52_12640 [Methanothrix sp.]